ncbi:MAG: hypothetical protein COV91_03690 [Candidatus Taylorbacteria bacterium CG11_big_fil_rev_8_21_14_0_20_46_11]|uniref:Uncharacterized protein n=1 Tax=Candidatus Taylorbacteria bacterium CG11_big_fil_rev_8_21_14_0_20_46_11 TaxID=1975025 RepID=A0A2H0KBA5_9BACT|nr:MAG: hypothetical protein COV91_03690 [Candidatus Taylorbacteria bacterium CG11_big_fil_rev_8_21_14_0_20_46_11]
MKTILKKYIGGGVVSFLFPLVTLATDTSPANTTDLLNNISKFLINPMIFTLFSIAFVVFIWGLVQFVANLNNEEARSTGGKHMIWGLIGMAIMVSVNGIIGIIDSTVKQIGG